MTDPQKASSSKTAKEQTHKAIHRPWAEDSSITEGSKQASNDQAPMERWYNETQDQPYHDIHSVPFEGDGKGVAKEDPQASKT